MANYPFIDLSTNLGRQIAEFDWAATPLGAIEVWPASLKIAVGLVSRSGFPKCLCWGPEMIVIHNDAFGVILGNKGNCLGQRFADVWAEAWPDIGPIADKALRGEATFVTDFPLEISRGNGQHELAFFTFSYSPVVDENGHVMGFMDTVIETSGRVRSENTAAIRNSELRHRMKNSYSVLSAIASQTFREFTDPQMIRETLMGRMQALSRAQDVLSLRDGTAGGLGEVVSRSLAPLLYRQQSRLVMEGPEVTLSEQQAVAVALAMHELATNALKYGSLSNEAGMIHVLWSSDARHPLKLVWRETGGPPVKTPKAAGFGSFLITDALATAFDGQVQVDYATDGIVLELVTGPKPAGSGQTH